MKQVIDHFISSLNFENTYTLKDLQKLLDVSYKKFNGTSKNSSDVKKTPSQYNIFIKEEIAKIKEENIEGVDKKDYMKIAAQRWQEHKNKINEQE